MNARLMTTGIILAIVVAAFAVAPQISAQSGSTAGKGIFSSLRVGQMVEFKDDDYGSFVITTYENDDQKPLMRHKVKETGHDYLALEFDDRDGTGTIAEVRIPAARVLVGHVSKTRGKATTGADDPLNDKPGAKSGTKPAKKKS